MTICPANSVFFLSWWRDLTKDDVELQWPLRETWDVPRLAPLRTSLPVSPSYHFGFPSVPLNPWYYPLGTPTFSIPLSTCQTFPCLLQPPGHSKIQILTWGSQGPQGPPNPTEAESEEVSLEQTGYFVHSDGFGDIQAVAWRSLVSHPKCSPQPS